MLKGESSNVIIFLVIKVILYRVMSSYELKKLMGVNVNDNVNVNVNDKDKKKNTKKKSTFYNFPERSIDYEELKNV